MGLTVKLDRRALNCGLAGGVIASLFRPGASNAEAMTSSFPSVVVLEAARIIRAKYVDPALADSMADFLLEKLRNCAYRGLPKNQLAFKLTEDLRSVTNDLHLNVSYEPPIL